VLGSRLVPGRSGRRPWAWYLVVAVVVFIAGAGASTRSGAASPNLVVLENQQPGTTSWQFTNENKASNHEIEGYASLTSVNRGSQIALMVSLSSSAQYNMDFYRMGWYPTGTNPNGTSCAPSCGGRLMLHVGPLNGSKQANCPTVTSTTDPNYGMIECNWTPSYTLAVPTTWTPGVYVVKLTRLDGTQLQNYMTFVVRDDSSTAPVLYSLDTNTWQAYNYWGGSGNNNVGINLYGRINDVTQNFISDTRAYTASFDRPYIDQGSADGAGNFFVWDFPMIRWMESQGYDMTYVTDTELETNPNLLLGHRVFVNTGHDEYYSDGMKSALQNGVNNGVNLALFSANNAVGRVTWSSDGSGSTRRRIHTSKGALPDNTGLYRYVDPPQPENALLGVMTEGAATARPFLVYNASNWIFAGTGLVSYTGSGRTGVITSGPGQNALPGIVGYEFDTRAVDDPSLKEFIPYDPPGLQQVGHSFVPASDNGIDAWSDATLYTAAGGGTVFSAGTIQWSFTVDNGFDTGFCDCDHHVANPIGQKITSNILARFGAPSTPAPLASVSPASLTYASTTVGTTSAAQNVTLTNAGTAAMTISSIGFAGASPGDYTQTSTCPVSPSTLAAGSSCNVSVSFAPTAAGTRTANLAITDDASASPQTVALTGTGAAGTSTVTLTPTTLTFASQAVGTTSASQTSTLRNTGTGPLTIASIAIAGTNSGDYPQTTTCPISPSTLAVNAACTISVTFKPTATGTRTANVAVTDNASGSPQRLTLSGTGATAAPAVSFSPTSLGFGSQAVGTSSAAQTVTLTNSGNAALTITAIGLGGTNAGDFGQTTTCPISPSTLAAGANCTLSVSFSPTASGNRTANISVTDNAGGSPQTVPLTGTGTAPAVTLGPASLSFTSQPVGTTSAAQTTTLTNSGTAALAIAAITVAGANAGDFTQTTTCPLSPATLDVNATCTISVRFSPGATGPRSAGVTIADNAANSPQTLGLSGTGSSPAPAVTLTPASLTFASQQVGTTSSAVTSTLANTGNAPLTISSLTMTGTNAGNFAATSNCPLAPTTLPVSGTCTVSVTFSPSGPGPMTASLSIADDAANSPQGLGVSGTGTAPAVTLSPTGLTFASQLVGTTSASQSIALTNSGTAPLTISTVGIGGANPGDYAQTNTCPPAPATLAVNAACTILVKFTPNAPGPRTASVQLADNAAGGSQSAGLTGSATAAAPALTVAPSSLTFGPQQVGTSSVAQSSTIQNTGTAPLTISGISLTGTNAAAYTQSSNCPTSPSTLAVSATCTISVIFSPTASGSMTAGVSVTDDASNSPQAIGLSGTGAVPAVTLTPTSLSFGSQTIGTRSAAQTTTLKNSGTAPLLVSSVGITGTNAGDFAQTNTCPVSPATLAASATCTISVTFSPSATGSRSASVTITDNATGTPQSVTLSGTGASQGAIAFDKNLGSKGENVNSATMMLTTTAPAAPNTRVFVLVDWYHASRTLTSVSGGGLTWSVDVQAIDPTRYHAAVASANAPIGLPAGTVITATFSGSVVHGLIAAASFTGVASTSPLDATATNTQGTGASWTGSVTTTNPTDLVIGWSGIDGATTSTPTAPNIEIHDLSDSIYWESETSVYRIESTPGSKTVNGTWANTSNSTANVTVVAAYKGG
jgi:Abnormal spindle-like microcephaly-assoc'd, ASPM-SPD-2-Hydin